ncbi:MAG: hypothetical protein A2Y12_02295 [Planctomycetes bacterium GWF2_42_9]|nr:MAG: hypothetical protein A2Y12_02295 [Planctomycetes bacterium GWF2_42_9]
MKTPNTKGFTIAELMVAVAIMAIALTAMGWVFKISIDAQRMSAATTEISRKLRAITDQIEADFQGVRVDMPAAIYNKRSTDDGIAADRIWFVANGDFQTTRQYKNNGTDKTVFGNMAQITYAMSEEDVPNKVPNPLSTDPKDGDQKYLLRRQTIFTADTEWADPANTQKTEYIEKASMPWMITNIVSEPNNSGLQSLTRIPLIPSDGNDVPFIIAKGVENFRIEMLNAASAIDPNGALNWADANDNHKIKTYPQALKFSFRLYSKTKINGKPLSKSFSHIVDLQQ